MRLLSKVSLRPRVLIGLAVLVAIVLASVCLQFWPSNRAELSSTPRRRPTSAQSASPRFQREADQRRYQEAVAAAEKKMSRGMWGVRLASLVVAWMFVRGANNTLRKGFNLTAHRKVTGKSAKIVAALLVLSGVVVALVGWVAVPLYMSF